MSYQTQQVIAALPGTVSQISERTGYPVARVLGFIVEARAEGTKIFARRQLAGYTVFELIEAASTAPVLKPVRLKPPRRDV